MRPWLLRLLPIGLLLLSGCISPPQPTGEESGRLQTILARGRLRCGISGELPGFSFLNPQGEYSGLDVDICRAIAAALFDDPEAVDYRPLNAAERFTAVQTGEVDVLSRNTTWTLSRDSSVGMDFAPVIFYDGQGIMVRRDSGFQSLESLTGRAICTQTGTTNEQNLADQMRQRGLANRREAPRSPEGERRDE
ncbi:transporter substrate-binding domain-containing protein, partial [Synechococcales cyanobacterium C]